MRFHASSLLRLAGRLAARSIPAVALLVAARVDAQAQGGPVAPSPTDSLVPVAGRVRGADGIGIANAEVTITPRPSGVPVTLPRRLYSDDSGGFHFPPLPRGPATLAVRRIGYKPVSVETTIPSDVPLNVLLESSAQKLTAVVVNERRRVYEGPLADFNRRRDFGIGRFITRGMIDERNPIRTTDLLRLLPGVQVVSGFRGTMLRLRGAGCDPLVWIDGTPALAGYFDIDAFAPNSLDGIEVYNGVSEVPVELRGPRGEERCGVVAVWSRMPERRPKQSKKKPLTAEEINALLASATVYTAEQVDRPVQVDSEAPVEPYYPDSLRAKHASGTAVVEFVVDTAGKAEPETISVVLASHPGFARAAREAIFSAKFVPALLRGRTVRQIVQLPVEFKANGPPVRK
jgi:TonB family protein